MTRNYFNFAGRARRKEFWGYCLFWTVMLIILIGLFATGDGQFRRQRADRDGGSAASSAGDIPAMARLIVRRLHDIGLTGWLYLLFFVPTIGACHLVFALIPTRPENQWGPVPAGVRV